LADAKQTALNLPEFVVNVSDAKIESILNGKRWTLNTPFDEIGLFEKFHYGRFFADICTREDAPDIRAVWEAARLQHVTFLVTLLNSAYGNSNKERTASFIRHEILEWIRRNPFLKGPHYLSAMECGLRVPVFVNALNNLPHLTEPEKDEIVTAIYQHAWWTYRRLSLYASLGNHTVCECVGLVFAGGLYRKSKEGQKWIKKGITLLDQELAHQVLSDGGPVEQSFSYHRFVLDLFGLVYDFIKLNQLSDVDRWKEKLKKGERFLKIFQQDNCGLPNIGDSDDGYAVVPDLIPHKSTEAAASIGAHLFKDSGYSVFRSDDTFFTFDHGPLGMGPLYNHGHADALAVTLAYKHRPILIDPGTFRYNGVPEWRHYFKSTRAHNTVTVDGQDQAIQANGFIWRKPYRCSVVNSEGDKSRMHTVAEHDGYQRLKHPVIHRRTVQITGGELLLEDRFKGEGSHSFELNFHFHPDVEFEKSEDGWIVANEKARCAIRLSNGHNLSPIVGAKEPILGWYSQAYGQKQPTTTLTCTQNSTPDQVIFKTIITFL